jgi:hypothetical protein
LKHDSGAAGATLKEMKKLSTVNRTANGHADVEDAITYFSNQNKKGRMDYAAWVEEDLPIGSGVTEAACKVIVKQRLCGSGMKWKEPGAAAMLSVRCLTYTRERWSQFWGKIDRYGFPSLHEGGSTLFCGTYINPRSNPLQGPSVIAEPLPRLHGSADHQRINET